MRLFLLSATIFLFMLVMIVLFQNLTSTMPGVWILLYSFDNQTLALPGIVFLIGLGGLLGVFVTLLAQTLLASGDQEEPGGASW